MKSKKIFFENLYKSNILITNKFKKRYLDYFSDPVVFWNNIFN